MLAQIILSQLLCESGKCPGSRNMIELNTSTWYTERELSYCPKHFVKASTALSQDRYIWIQEKLHGRYYVAKNLANDLESILSDRNDFPFFEDPQEAVYYELVWS